MLQMFDAAAKGELAALYVVGGNPVARYGIEPATLKNTFVVVQEMFLTETAQLADVVLPACTVTVNGTELSIPSMPASSVYSPAGTSSK